MLYQVLSVLFATISQISDGMVYGWASPAIPLLKSDNSTITIEDSDVVWIESIYWIGGICGVPISIFLVNSIGRKNSLLASSVLSLIHWIIIVFANHVYYLHLARFITGVSSDISFVAAPMFISELCSPEIRGILTSFTHIMVLIGILLVYAVLPFVSILTSSLIGALFLVIQLIVLPFFPETPYYHCLHHNYDEALKSLQVYRRNTSDSMIEEELEQIITAVKKENAETTNFKDLFLVYVNRKSIIITVVLNGAQHFAGLSVLIMNFQSILDDTMSTHDPKYVAIIMAVVMLVAASLATTIIDRYDRRTLLTISSILTGIALLLLASYFKLRHLDNLTYLPIIAIVCYIFSFKLGLAIIPYIIVAEIFPTNTKACGIAISDSSYVIFAALSIHFYQYTLHLYGNFLPIFTFAICSFATAVFVLLYVPETRAKSLPEIQNDLNKARHRRGYEEIVGNGHI